MPEPIMGSQETREGPKLVLSDGAVTLQPFELSDVEAHLAGDDPEQIKWLNYGHGSTVDSVTSWILRNQEQWRADGPVRNFAIHGDDGALAGMVEANLDYRSLEGLREGDANISYSLYPEARGKGYAARAVALLEQYLSGVGASRGVIRVDPRNAASMAVAHRLGYHEDGLVQTNEGDELKLFIKELSAD